MISSNKNDNSSSSHFAEITVTGWRHRRTRVRTLIPRPPGSENEHFLSGTDHIFLVQYSRPLSDLSIEIRIRDEVELLTTAFRAVPLLKTSGRSGVSGGVCRGKGIMKCCCAVQCSSRTTTLGIRPEMFSFSLLDGYGTLNAGDSNSALRTFEGRESGGEGNMKWILCLLLQRDQQWKYKYF